MAKQPEDQNDRTEQVDQTEVIPQQPDDTARLDADDTARMPSAADVPASPPAVGAPLWASAVHGPAEPAVGDDAHVAAMDTAAASPAGPASPAPIPVVVAAAPATGSPWWKGRLALAGAGLAAGLLLGGVVGATIAVAIGGDDRMGHVSEVGDRGQGGFDGEGRGPGGRHGGGQGEMPGQSEMPGGGQGQLPGGGEGQVPGGGTSTDPGDANGTDQTT